MSTIVQDAEPVAEYSKVQCHWWVQKHRQEILGGREQDDVAMPFYDYSAIP